MFGMFTKKKRSDWMKGLLYAESLIQSGESIHWITSSTFILELDLSAGDYEDGYFSYCKYNLKRLVK